MNVKMMLALKLNRRFALLGSFGFLISAGLPALAVDFIRGDTNGDGKISLSDAHCLNGYLFLGSPLDCRAAGDVNDNAALDISDTVFLLNCIFIGSEKIPSPFPAAGPDPTPDGWTSVCDSYGNGSPLEDPAAKIRIRDVVAPGGNERKVVITLAISSSVPIAGYTFSLSGLEGVLDPDTAVRKRDLSAPLLPDREDTRTAFFFSNFADGRYLFGTLFTFSEAVELPAGEDVPLLELWICLKPGTPAGNYALTLETGELAASCLTVDEFGNKLACPDTGRAIIPALLSGTLTIQSEVLSGTCDNTVPPPPPPPAKILFRLEEGTGSPGGEATVPLVVKTDRPTTGFSYSIRFDDTLLRCEDTRKLWQKPDGTPYDFEKFEWNNFSGYVMGAAIISLTDTGDVIPIKEEVEMLEIKFRVLPDAPLGITPLEFRDGGRGTGGPVNNKIIAGGVDITPVLESSFILINGRIVIIPDGTPFKEGDSNGDNTLDISDAIFTLNYLYQGGKSPPNPKAADFNGDGNIDISDPIATISYLYQGGK